MAELMKVRIAYTDTGTGEPEVIDRVVSELTPEAIAAHIEALDVETGSNLTVAAWIQHGDEFGFLFTSEEPFFGKVIWHGVVYTRFVG